MKKIYFFLFSTIIFAGCQKDEISSSLKNETTQEGAVQRIPFKDLPKQILQNFDGNKFIKIKKKLEGTAFGKARTDIDVYINTDKTATTYTIALNRSNKGIKSVDGLYFDNYVAKELQDGSLEEYVIRYLPDEVWYNQGNRELRDYSGEVIFFDLEGTKLGKTAIFDGQANAIDSNQNKGSCVITFKKMICTDGLYGLEGNCVYEYQLTCSSGSSYDSPPSGGDDGTPSWDSGDSSGGTGGDSTGDGDSGGPGSVNTNPIINDEGELITVECPLGQEPNEFGVCEEVEDFEDKIDTESLTDKAKCVYDKLNQNSTSFSEAIKKFDGEFPVSHLKFSINNLLPSGNYGVTNPPENYWIEIEMSNTQLGNISDLGSATAFVHETIHAEIYRKMLSAAQTGSLDSENMTIQQQVDYVNSLRNNFPGIYDYYIERYKPTWNHNMMAQHYTGTIADAIQEFDNYSQDRQVYEDIAWAGLRELEDGTTSVAWNNLQDSEKQRILSSLSDHFFNGPSNCN